MTEEMKINLFELMLELTHLSETQHYDHHDYFEQSNGAFKMLIVLGLDKEYINWSVKKERGLS